MGAPLDDRRLAIPALMRSPFIPPRVRDGTSSERTGSPREGGDLGWPWFGLLVCGDEMSSSHIVVCRRLIVLVVGLEGFAEPWPEHVKSP